MKADQLIETVVDIGGEVGSAPIFIVLPAADTEDVRLTRINAVDEAAVSGQADRLSDDERTTRSRSPTAPCAMR